MSLLIWKLEQKEEKGAIQVSEGNPNNTTNFWR